MIYWDTSCALKLYAPEPDSEAYLSMADRGIPLLSSEILALELSLGLLRKEGAGDLCPGGAHRLFERFQSDVQCGRFALLPCGGDVIARAIWIGRTCRESEARILLRSLDAIHLATAAIAKASRLVTTDVRMRAAAEALGMRLLSPVSG